MRNTIIKKIENAPRKPGVYIFYGKKNLSLYIGKAADLRARLKNYLLVSDYKTELLSKEAKNLKMIVLRSEIEALLEESRLIKNLKPRYNIMWRDNKSYFYVAFTKEKFPKIFITHKRLLYLKSYILNLSLIGPFTDGRSLYLVLRFLRRQFPYCTCLSAGQAGKTSHFRNCLNAEIDNCLGFCCKKDSKPSVAEIKNYKRNIEIIKNFLLGKLSAKNLKELSPNEQKAVNNILAHRQFVKIESRICLPAGRHGNLDLNTKIRLNFKFDIPYSKIECYDISHLGGKEAVGAMTAWHNGIADKTSWRKFKIRTAGPGDDPAAIQEILSRRFKHHEWPYPDLIIIDGGIAQLNAAKKAAKNLSTSDVDRLKIIAFAKPGAFVHGYCNKPTPLREMPDELQKLIPSAIAETHRFAISYHRKIRKRSQFL